MSKTLINKAEAQLELHKNREAKESTDRILKHDAKNSDAWRLKGNALRKLHQTKMADKCFEKAEQFKKVPRSLLE